MNKRFRSFLLTIPLLTIGLFFFFLTYGTALAQETSFHADGRILVFDTIEAISPEQELEIRVQFPHGVVSDSAPAWQARTDQKDGATDETTAPWTTKDMLIVGFSLLLLVGGFLSVIMLWWTKGRDHPVEFTVEYLTKPPDDLPPGVVGTLVDNQADLQDIMATLLDLARKGAIGIEEMSLVKTGSVDKKDTDFLYVLKDREKATSKAEITLVEEFFGGYPHRYLKDLHQKFYNSIPKINEALYEEVVKWELFEENPENVREKYENRGCLLGLPLFGFLFCCGSMIPNSEELLNSTWMCIPVALTLIGIMLWITGDGMVRKTKVGSEAASKWNAFRSYLENMEKYDDLEDKKEIWDQYLPYAVAFGLEKSYIEKFAKINAPAPTWYIPYDDKLSSDSSDSSRDESTNSGLQNISDGLLSMLSLTAETLKSEPPSKSRRKGPR